MIEPIREMPACAVPPVAEAPFAKRRDAIARYRIIDTANEGDFDNIVKLAAQIFNVAHAAISFVIDDRQWFKAQQGFEVRDIPVEHLFCAHALDCYDNFKITVHLLGGSAAIGMTP